MKDSPSPHEVRQLILRCFRELGVEDLELSSLVELILVQQACYRGRSYRARDLMAMWLIEVGIVQFYGSDGTMLRTINLLEEPVAETKAA